MVIISMTVYLGDSGDILECKVVPQLQIVQLEYNITRIYGKHILMGINGSYDHEVVQFVGWYSAQYSYSYHTQLY